MTKEQQITERNDRMNAAISFGKPDRVPFAPKTSAFFIYGYDISFYDAMVDARNMEHGFRSYMRDYEPDAVSIGGIYSIPVLQTLMPGHLRWPGPDCGIPLESSFQFLDGTYLEDSEYPEFILDPTHTILTKVLPRKNKNLAGLSKLYVRELYDAFFHNDLSIFADPEVVSALFTLIEAGKRSQERQAQLSTVREWIADEGYPTYCQGTLVIPFDAFADCVRGIITTAMDLIEFPDELEQVVNKLTEMNVERLVKVYKSRGAKRIFIPLHCGSDSFMSEKHYEKVYWPCLKKCITIIIENEITPVVFCQGTYNTRLEVISDVPKGKVVYMFENVDIKKAKETVGKVACIAGNVSNALLSHGTKEQVVNETRTQIDILAPGGGFIMDCSMMLDNAKHENMRAWRDTTYKYGEYR